VLLEDAFVGGHITSTGSVILDATAIVSGTITEYANIPPIPPITDMSLYFISGRRDVTVSQGNVQSLDPGVYRRVVVKRGATLQLRTGHYVMDEINVEQDSRVEFDLAEGIILVDVVKNVAMGDSTQMEITSSDGTASDILFRVAGLVVDLGRSGNYLGTYLAPNANVSLDQNAFLTGALYGAKININQAAHISGVIARELFAGLYYNPAIVSIPELVFDEPWIFLPLVVRIPAGASNLEILESIRSK
jgi:antitoxin component of MazEF toxin-antitoxin module